MRHRGAAAVALAIALFAWMEIARAGETRGRGVVVEHPDGASAQAEATGRLFERARDEIGERLGLPVDREVRVVIATGRSGFVERVHAEAGGVPPDWSMAVAIPGRDLVVIDRSKLRELTPSGLPSTLRHELAHVLLRPVGGAIPLWLNEGIAAWCADAPLTDAQLAALGAHARAGTLIGLDDLAGRFPPHEAEASLAYLEAQSFVEWVEADGGPGTMRRLVSRVAAGEPFDRAFERATGRSAATAEIYWRRDLAESSSWWRDLLMRIDVWAIASLLAIAAYARYLWKRRRLLSRMDAEEAREAEARRDRARDAGGPTPPPAAGPALIATAVAAFAVGCAATPETRPSMPSDGRVAVLPAAGALVDDPRLAPGMPEMRAFTAAVAERVAESLAAALRGRARRGSVLDASAVDGSAGATGVRTALDLPHAPFILPSYGAILDGAAGPRYAAIGIALPLDGEAARRIGRALGARYLLYPRDVGLHVRKRYEGDSEEAQLRRREHPDRDLSIPWLRMEWAYHCDLRVEWWDAATGVCAGTLEASGVDARPEREAPRLAGYKGALDAASLAIVRRIAIEESAR